MRLSVTPAVVVGLILGLASSHTVVARRVRASHSSILSSSHSKGSTLAADLNKAISSFTLIPNRSRTSLQSAIGSVSNDTSATAISDAVATVASTLTGDHLNHLSALGECLADIVQKGGIPSGHTCLLSNNATAVSLHSTFNTVIEQFVGVIPPNVVKLMQTAVSNSLTGLLPGSSSELMSYINNAVLSVTASLSGNVVSAIQSAEDCFAKAALSSNPQGNIDCLTAPGGSLTYIETGLDGVVEQFVGYLPPNVVQAMQNILKPLLGTIFPPGTPAGDMLTQLNNAFLSVAADLSGNGVTLFEQMQQCMNDVVQLHNATQAVDCFKGNGGPLNTVQVAFNGIIQQYFGYLPPNLVIDLQNAVTPLVASTPAAGPVKTALDKLFEASGAGPAFVTCFESAEACIVGAIQSGSTSAANCAPSNACQVI